MGVESGVVETDALTPMTRLWPLNEMVTELHWPAVIMVAPLKVTAPFSYAATPAVPRETEEPSRTRFWPRTPREGSHASVMYPTTRATLVAEAPAISTESTASTTIFFIIFCWHRGQAEHMAGVKERKEKHGRRKGKGSGEKKKGYQKHARKRNADPHNVYTVCGV